MTAPDDSTMRLMAWAVLVLFASALFLGLN
jgi:hypothetical protein